MSRREGWTLAQLREFHAREAWQLAEDKKRRGAWPGEDDRREAYDATVRLIDKINADHLIMARLKGKA